MIIALLVGLLSFATPIPAEPVPQSHRDPGCDNAQTCRAMALEAADRGDFERFHDLAWRAVQTGSKNDPALMLLLARAQVLSGRPHDALVMLDRLAQMGVWSDAATNDDFARTRELPGWSEIAARLERLRPTTAPVSTPATPRAAPSPGTAPNAPPPRIVDPSATVAPPSAAAAPAPSPTTAAPPPAPASPDPAVPNAAPVNAAKPEPSPSAVEIAHFPANRVAVAGLAYDAVSRRYVFGDRAGRKVVVVSEGSNQPLDLVRAESAGFHEISAVDIDERRGDLWVASAGADDGGGTLHRLQLVSGRPLKSFRLAPAGAPVNPVDVAVMRGGTVLVLDAANQRILALRPGTPAVEVASPIRLTGATSLAAGAEDEIVYIAHQDGLARVDVRLRKSVRMAAPAGASLAGLRQIRWYNGALIAVAGDDSGSRIVRLDLNASGRAVTRVTILVPSAAIAGDASVTIAGDDLLYVGGGGGSRSAVALAARTPGELVVYRVHLR